jgi:hypothetical protein
MASCARAAYASQATGSAEWRFCCSFRAGGRCTLAATLALTTWVKAPVTSGCSRQTMLESRHSFARYLGDPHTPPAVAGLQAPVDLAGAAVEVEHVQHLRRPVRGGHRADHVVVELVEPDAR